MPQTKPAKVSKAFGHRPTIGFLTSSLRDPYATFTWTDVMEAAKERDFNVLNIVGSRLRSSTELEQPERVIFDLVDPALLDGLVVFSEMLYHFVSVTELKEFLRRFEPLPMTSIGLVDGIPSVMLDKELGMKEMVDHLVEVHGYRRLAYLSGPAGEQTAEALYRGYLKGLAQHGIAFDPDLVSPNHPVWGDPIGGFGVGVLLDERGLRPGLDFDCIVACGDREALTAVEALQLRGIRVPYDVAITGFNNLEHAHLAHLSLTTGDRRVGEVARRATEMLLDILEGKPVPASELLSPELVVRWSCGCIPDTVRQAASITDDLGARPAKPSESANPIEVQKLNQARREVISSLKLAWSSALIEHIPGIGPDWAEQLVDSLFDDLFGGTAGEFLKALEEILRSVVSTGSRVTVWQDILSEMRRAVRPYLWEFTTYERAENLWQQARTLLGDFAEREQGFRRLHDVSRVRVFNSIIQRLMTTFDLGGIMDVLAEDLPRLGISSCYLSLYENPSEPLGWARLLLAYDEIGRIPLETGGTRFAAPSLIPPGLLRTERRLDLAAFPLHFHDHQLGFVVFEMGPTDGNIYEALRTQIGSAMMGASLATRNEELYREAVEARKTAEAADNMKSRFLSAVSHELRTPLSLIVGTIEMQLREEATGNFELPELYRRDLKNIRASAHHLNHLIGDVLDLASSQAGRLRLDREMLSLSTVLADVITLGEAMAREKGLAWHSDIPADLPMVWGDRTRLQQVTLNLISNAVKFTHKGTVTLWVEVGKEQLMVAVSDTGLGIPVDEQDNIFHEFHQSDRTIDQGFGGKGLGLAISRRLVELHGGQIGVQSSGTTGSGSTFYYTLPVMKQAGADSVPSTDREGIVLILSERSSEENQLYKHLVSRGFAAELLDVNATSDWREAIIAAPPGAIVLDYDPESDRGWEIMRDLRDYLPAQEIPVIFYTLSEGRNQGAVLDLDYLAKPVSSSGLASALARQGLMAADSNGDRVILVVDDDRRMHDLYTRMLSGLVPGCQIARAMNGREALEMMAQKRPNLVLLDLVMPVLDGYAVLEAMQESQRTRDIPVIVLTAQVLTEHDMARLRMGVDAVLAKGLYSGDELMEQVEIVLRRNKRICGDTQWAMRQTMAFIHENYSKPISRTELAARVALSERYLTQCFRSETGLTPIKYLSRYRIRRACELLAAGDKNITEVAMAVGFTDPSYFARVFREETGITPRAYQMGARPDN